MNKSVAQTYTCPICKTYQSKSITIIASHLGRKHKDQNQYNRQQLYLDLVLGGAVAPTCKCGCGEEVKFLNVEVGFREYKQGHISRVVNNYQTEKSRTNSKNTKQKQVESGELRGRPSWSRGLTKETDERIKKRSEAITSNEVKMRILSERFKRMRTDGTVRTLHGPKHSQWKGGISSLNNLCRSYPRLYKEWKYPKLLESGFKCSECGNTKQLEVHHDGETFSSILRKVAKEHGWEWSITTSTATTEEIEKLKQAIKDGIVDHHVRENVSGKVLCVVCHENLHESYNFGRDEAAQGVPV